MGKAKILFQTMLYTIEPNEMYIIHIYIDYIVELDG